MRTCSFLFAAVLLAFALGGLPAGASPRGPVIVGRPFRFTTNVTGHTGYYTYHYDGGRTGWNPHETALTTATVGPSHFGYVRHLLGDSVVYAQPLYVPNLQIGSATHNTVIFATENDSVYAYDADTGAALWHRTFLDPAHGVTAVSIASVNNCAQITPTIGVSSTPVIDPSTQTLYVVDKIQIAQNGTTTYHTQIHALALTSGGDKLTPAEIAGSIKRSDGSVDTFAARYQQNRPGLVLANGMVYVGFGSSCDEDGNAVHGWMFGYGASNLHRNFIVNTTASNTSSSLGSIWQSTYAPAVDSSGNLYFTTGNGSFNAQNGGADYGESVLRTTSQLAIRDYFAPYNEASLSNSDEDVGSVGVMLIPNSSGSKIPLAVSGVKSGTIYLLNQNKLGEFNASGDNVVQKIYIGNGGDSLFGGPAYYANHVYWGSADQPMQSFALAVSPAPKLTFQSQTTNKFNGEGGEIPAVSSNGTTAGTAIVWATSRPPTGSNVTLYAYDATNLAKMLFSGAVGTWRATDGAFLTPTIADGHVFVPGAGYGVAEFGLH